MFAAGFNRADLVTLIFLALIVAAVYFGRRNGRAQFARSIATAKSEARAELRAELAASSHSSSGVVFNAGNGSASGGDVDVESIACRVAAILAGDGSPNIAIDNGAGDYDNGVVGRGEFRGGRALLGAAGRGVGDGVGELQDGARVVIDEARSRRVAVAARRGVGRLGGVRALAAARPVEDVESWEAGDGEHGY